MQPSATFENLRTARVSRTGAAEVPGVSFAVSFLLVGTLLAFGFFVEQPAHEVRWLFVQLLGAVGLTWLADGRATPPARLLVPLGLFLAAAGFSGLYAMDAATSRLTLLRLTSLAGVAVLGFGLARSPRETRRVLEVAVWALAAHAVIAVAIWAMRPEGFWPRLRAGYPIGLFGHKNHAGEAVATVLVVGLALLRGDLRRQKPFLVALGLLSLHLGILRARGAWVGAVGASAMILLLSQGAARKRRTRVVAGLAVVAAIPNLWFFLYRGVPPGLEHEPQYRLTATRQMETRYARWLNTAVMIGDAPLLGHGPGGYIHAYPKFHRAVAVDDEPGPVLRVSHAHNLVLDALAEYGALGLAALALLAAGAMRLAGERDRNVRAATRLRRLLGRWARRRAVSKAAAAGLLALVLAGMFGYPFHVPATACLTALLLGVFAGSGARRASRKAPSARGLRLDAWLRPAAGAAAIGVVAFAAVTFAGSMAARAGTVRLARGDAHGAVPLLELAVRLRPERDLAHVALARALAASGHGDQAIAVLDERLATVPTYALGWVHRSRLLGAMGHRAEALESLRRGCREVPNVSRRCPATIAGK